jgi:serine/threonine-protein kinase
MSLQTFDPDRTTGTIAPDQDAAPSAELPRWVLGEGGDFAPADVLGEGGMSIVTRALQAVPHRTVALKRPRRPGNQTEVSALLREGEVTAQVEHPNVVPIHAIGRDEQGDPVVVLRELHGRTLADVLRVRPTEPAAWRKLVAALIAVSHALEAAHHQGFVHCDVKAANVLLGDFGETWLVDWGIAVPAGTAAGFPRGTPAYFAPEQAHGRAVDARTDVYLLGATLHHVLTGQPRHAGKDLDDFTRSAERAEPTAWDRSVPPLLGALADRCCRPDPAERPASVQVVRESLESWIQASHLDGLVDAALRELQVALDGTAPDPITLRVQLVKAQFALSEAARSGNPRALDGLVEALDALIEADLASGNVVSARTWATNHPRWTPAREAAVVDRQRSMEAALEARARAERDWGLAGQRGSLLLQLAAVGGGLSAVASLALGAQYLQLFNDVAVIRVAVPIALLGMYLPGRHLVLTRSHPGHLVRTLLDSGAVFLVLMLVSRLLLGVWAGFSPAVTATADLLMGAAWMLGLWPVFRTAPLQVLASVGLVVAHLGLPGHDALFLNLQVFTLLGFVGWELLRDDRPRPN